MPKFQKDLSLGQITLFVFANQETVFVKVCPVLKQKGQLHFGGSYVKE